jgi:hypothetical protein
VHSGEVLDEVKTQVAADGASIRSARAARARPAAVRHGWREDALCASVANTSVRFDGRDVPVCHMQRAMYARWGERAEANAKVAWTGPWNTLSQCRNRATHERVNS